MTEREQVFEFRDIPSPPTPSLLRGFSAPVRLTTNLDPDQIEFLMMHDSDPFNRWQAAQTYALTLLTNAARGNGDLATVKGKEAARLAQALGATASDDGFAAGLSRRIPQTSERIGHRAGAWPRGRHRLPCMRRARPCAQAIGNEIRQDLAELYERAAMRGPYSPDPESAGRRALRAAALDLLVATGEPAESRAPNATIARPPT